MSAQPNFTFPYPLRHPGDAPPGEAPPRLWYQSTAQWGGRTFLRVLRGVPSATGETRWICYGPAWRRLEPGLQISCAPGEARKRCVLMLLQYIDGTVEWMPQGRSALERELLPHSPKGW